MTTAQQICIVLSDIKGESKSTPTSLQHNLSMCTNFVVIYLELGVQINLEQFQ